MASEEDPCVLSKANETETANKKENYENDIRSQEVLKINIEEPDTKLWDSEDVLSTSTHEILKLEKKYKDKANGVKESKCDLPKQKSFTKKMEHKRKSGDQPRPSSTGQKGINLLRFAEEISCKDLDDSSASGTSKEDHQFTIGAEKEACTFPFPSMDDLPDDDEELEDLMKKLISGMNPDWKRHRSGKPYSPGTMSSAANIQYRLADLTADQDPAEAVSRGDALCSCTEDVVIDGETANLQQIEEKIDELKRNHKATTVTVVIKNKKATVNDKISKKTEAQSYTSGPALLTKYCLERLCETIGSHPKLSSLKLQGLPLSQPCRAMLVPSFATLRELSLVGTKLGDVGLKLICRYVWRSGNLRVLDVSDNQIGWEGVRHLRLMVQRRGALRTEMEDFFGVERLTLDKNPIGYNGFKELLKCASEDFYLKALDVRDCQLSRGDEEALEFVTSHREVQVLDLRDNNLRLIGEVVRAVLKNCPPDRADYQWRDKEDLQKYLKDGESLPLLIINS